MVLIHSQSASSLNEQWRKRKVIFNRLRRLEDAVAPAERHRAADQEILKARRLRLEADYKPIDFPPGWFTECGSTADHILRARQFRMEHPGATKEVIAA
jgi:hypothetical protein